MTRNIQKRKGKSQIMNKPRQCVVWNWKSVRSSVLLTAGHLAPQGHQEVSEHYQGQYTPPTQPPSPLAGPEYFSEGVIVLMMSKVTHFPAVCHLTTLMNEPPPVHHTHTHRALQFTFRRLLRKCEVQDKNNKQFLFTDVSDSSTLNCSTSD